jgi:hypothetical protein
MPDTAVISKCLLWGPFGKNEELANTLWTLTWVWGEESSLLGARPADCSRQSQCSMAPDPGRSDQVGPSSCRQLGLHSTAGIWELL